MTRLPVLSAVVLLCGCGSGEQTSGLLVIDPPAATVTVGEGGDTSPQQVKFKLRNDGGQPLTIRQIESPCCNAGVSVAQPLEKRTLQPGDSTDLILKATPPRIGRNEKVVRIHTDISPASPLSITVKFVGEELHPPYLMRAKTLDLELSGSKAGTVAEREMKLCAVERAGTNPWIESLTSSSKMVSAKLIGEPEEMQMDQGIVLRSYIFQVTAIIPNSIDVPVAAAMEIGVSSPSQSPVHGFLAFARLTSIVRAVPSQLFIQNEPLDSFPIDRKILLIPTDGDKMRFTLASALPEWLEVIEDYDTARLPPGAQRFSVRVKCPVPQPRISEETVEFLGDDEDATIVKVPIRLSIDSES